MYDRLPVFHLVGSSAYKPGLENTFRILAHLDNPHEKFRSIHVAGTNGKGSVSHLLAAILQESGYRVGLYTSPHLVNFGERIRLNGEMIDEQYVVDFIKHNLTTIENIQPSFFELTMAMAFSYFADQKVDIAVIEVGLGGRLDSTNIIHPELSIITNIGFDHTEFLGNTLAAIASEKAGIIKADVPVVIGETLPETKPVFLAKAALMESAIVFADTINQPQFKSFDGDNMIFTHHNQTYQSGLIGLYQLKNLATVFSAIDALKVKAYDISPEAVRSGIANVCRITGLRGRWERLQSNPAVIADTGHNVQGIQEVVNQLKHQKYKTLRIIFGMVNDKDISGVLQLLPKNAVYYFTQAKGKRALAAAELQLKATAYTLNGKCYDTIQKALYEAFSEAEKTDLILITGSNFVVGESMTLLPFSSDYLNR